MKPLLRYPVKNTYTSQAFGFDNSNHPSRRDFYVLFDNKHPGVDFPVSNGTSVYSSLPGIVVRNEYHKGMGNVIGIRNGNIVTLYAHLLESKVELGEIINDQKIIGISGETGKACTEPHLHFEIRDLTKNNLKEMVFEPIFNKQVRNFKEEFTYKVNNINTKKTLEKLSLLYFGTPHLWNLIRNNNPDLSKHTNNQLLEQGMTISIPNYTISAK